MKSPALKPPAMKSSALWRNTALAAGLAVLVLLPLTFTSNETLANVAVLTLIYVGAAIAWNLFSGYSGYISLGHAVFFGCGAYTVALLSKHWSWTGGRVWWLFPLGALAAGVTAVPFGLIALRVRRHTFVVTSIAIFFIFQLMAYNLSFTGGSAGLYPPYLNWDAATFNNPFYYTALAIAVLAGVLSWLIRGSRFGLQLRAIRDDEDRARGLGVKAMRVKLTAFVISAVITGLLGGLYFYFVQEALPQYAFNPFFDLTIALMTFLGGIGTLSGPILGALILEPLQDYAVVQLNDPYLADILLGAVFLLVILFLPRGIIPVVSERITAWRGRQQRKATVADPGSRPSGAVTAGAVRPGQETGAPSGGGVR